MKILYLYVQTRLTELKPHVFLGFIRISNYLNSRKHEINGVIEEEYLDLGFEDLPKFIPENIKNYREKLKKILLEYKDRFPFQLVAISCYTSLNYMNCVEIASLIKKEISPSCMIVVGGIHPSICPEDFQIGNFPNFIYKKYPQNQTPFDYLIKNEGEIPFFNLVKGLIEETIEIRKNSKDPLIFIKPQIIENLNDLPIINFELFEKYRSRLNKELDFPRFSLDLSRGCIFRCRFCYNSGKNLAHYKKMRIKSVEKSIKELLVIKNTDWLNINDLFITDMIFLAKRSKKSQFFKELGRIIEKEGVFPFRLLIMDRIITCSKENLHDYKKYNIFPLLGLESCSTTLLSRTGKFYGKNNEEISKAIDSHLLKFEEIVKEANILDLDVAFFYIMGLPGSDAMTFKQNKNYLFKPRSDGKSLIDNYKINFLYNKYTIYKNTAFYDCCEEEFGSKIYYKEWWKIFDEYYHYYPALVDPSFDFSLTNSISKNLRLFRKIYKIQQKLGNSYYQTKKLEAGNKAAEDVVFLIQRKKNEQIIKYIKSFFESFFSLYTIKLK